MLNILAKYLLILVVLGVLFVVPAK